MTSSVVSIEKMLRPLAPMDTRLLFTSFAKGVSRDLISTCLNATFPVGLITQM
ncbi:MAG: hypothetical protein ACFB2X_06080 [Rivularia sp. (in: cyanobacteria)]